MPRLTSLMLALAVLLPARAELISYWSFNDGTSARDEVGENHGIEFVNYNGGPTHSSNVPPGGGAYSLVLTNGNDLVTLPPPTNGIDREFTMSMWVNYNGFGRSIFSIKRDLTSGGGDRSGLGLGIQAGKAYVGLISSQPDNAANTAIFHDIQTTMPVPSNQWVHLAATFKDDKVTIYINGVAETTYAGAGSPDGTVKALGIGQGIDFVDANGSFTGFGADGSNANPTEYYDGLIDEVAIWSSALDAQDIQALAGGAAPPSVLTLSLTGIEPAQNANFLPASTAIRFTGRSMSGLDNSGFKLILNGVDRSGDLVVTGADPVGEKTASFTGLLANQDYIAEISITDRAGKSRSQTVRFNTYSEGTLFIEAEDYDFGGGQYINDPQLASFPADNNYLDRAGTPGVDHQVLRQGNANPYRIGDPVGTGFADDVPLRDNFATAQLSDPGVEDYALNALQNGEWLNYTRNFPNGTYRVFARAASTGSFDLQFGAVTGTPAAQQVVALGAFNGSSTAGYELVPLRDAAGNTLVISAGGEQTFRVTVVGGGPTTRLNYLFFVPAEATNRATVTVVEPADGALGVGTAAVIRAVIVNQGTRVKPDTIRLTVNGTDVTSGTEQISTAQGVTLSYVPGAGWPEGSVQNVRLSFEDDAPTPNVTTSDWSFTVRRIPSGNTPEIFADAVFRVTFAGNNPSDRTTGNVSEPVTIQSVTYTTDVPPMANRTGTAAVFNGTDSFISYGLGAGNELALRSNLTYHARVRYNPVAFAAGRPEQWIFGRFRASTTDTSTRVSILSTSAAAAGSTSARAFAGVSADGAAWAVGLPGQDGIEPGVFHDIFLRFEPGVAMWLDVFNSETGARVGTSQRLPTTVTELKDAASPLDVGNRTHASTVPLAGDIEQITVWARTLSDAEIFAINSGSMPPSTGVTIQGLRVAGTGQLELTFEASGADSDFGLESTGSLSNPQWAPVSGVTIANGANGAKTATFATPSTSPQFYRVVQN